MWQDAYVSSQGTSLSQFLQHTPIRNNVFNESKVMDRHVFDHKLGIVDNNRNKADGFFSES